MYFKLVLFDFCAVFVAQSCAANINRLPGELSKEKCIEYSKQVTSCGHDVVELSNGTSSVTIQEFPHMVRLGFESSSRNNTIVWSCEGSIISEEYILTVGLCLIPSRNGLVKYVQVGVTDVNNETFSQRYNVVERIPHPDYGNSSYYNDIGLVKVDRKIEFGQNVRPACLNTNNNLNTEKLVATGYGIVYQGLRKTIMNISDSKQCDSTYPVNESNLYKGIDHETHLCASPVPANGTNIYESISGDPLQIYHLGNDAKCMYDIVGIVSFGVTSRTVPFPEVSTRISHYVGWIESVVWG